MSSIFDRSKKSTTSKKTKNEKNEIIVNDTDFFEKVEKLEELQTKLKETKDKADLISDELKNIAKREWCSLYENTSENPESITVVQNNDDDFTASIMLTPSDRYITINEDRAEELKDTYGDEIVEEKTTFSFDEKMIEKYGDILSDFILNCDEIDNKDREKIIKSTTTYTVAKGTINKLKEYGEVVEMIETIKPVFSIKNVEIIKG